MSNYVSIARTVFQSLDSKGGIVSETYGIRVYDSYGAYYSNNVESRQALLNISQSDMIEMAKYISDEASEMIIDAVANDKIWFDD